MKLLKLFEASKRASKPVVVQFAGGMGAQIINVAAYHHLRKEGREVFADVSYFQRPERLATPGNKGQLTHWSWQLGAFNLHPSSFQPLARSSMGKREIVSDGPRMLQLGLSGLTDPSIQELFPIPIGTAGLLPEVFTSYLCIHVRRGDFVNVASHLVKDSDFTNLTNKLKDLLDNAVVLSDSPVGSAIRAAISSCFRQVLFLDNTDSFSAHRIMRNARILVCSNSTFSLTAAMLNRRALVLIPRQWYDGSHREMEAAMHSRCTFEILDTPT